MTAPLTPADLIRLRTQLDAWIKAESKKFEDFVAPHKAKVAEWDDMLLAYLNENKLDKVTSEHGTAYRSVIPSFKVEDRDKYIDWCMDNWEKGGNELLLVQVQKDAAKEYQEKHQTPPPGCSTSAFTRVNIRRS